MFAITNSDACQVEQDPQPINNWLSSVSLPPNSNTYVTILNECAPSRNKPEETEKDVESDLKQALTDILRDDRLMIAWDMHKCEIWT